MTLRKAIKKYFKKQGVSEQCQSMFRIYEVVAMHSMQDNAGGPYYTSPIYPLCIFLDKEDANDFMTRLKGLIAKEDTHTIQVSYDPSYLPGTKDYVVSRRERIVRMDSKL